MLILVNKLGSMMKMEKLGLVRARLSKLELGSGSKKSGSFHLYYAVIRARSFSHHAVDTPSLSEH